MAHHPHLRDRTPALAPIAGSERSSPGSPDLADLANRVADLQVALQEFLQMMLAMYASMCRTPVHMEVDRLEVERMEFRMDSLDIAELSGQLNIGLTTTFPTYAGQRGEEAQREQRGSESSPEPTSSARAAPTTYVIWPRV